jgi:murein DD-endopeptidase MepM/ murein hydrolase activator NlpD
MSAMREGWIGQGGGGVTAAMPLAYAPAGFGQKKPPFSMVVDLGDNLFTRTWWRGAATLALLGTALGVLSPGLDPLPGRMAPAVPTALEGEWQANGVGALQDGSPSGRRMAANAQVRPIAIAPERVQVALKLTVGADGLGPALVRAGARYADAVRAHDLARGAGAMPRPGTQVDLTLGKREAGRRGVQRIAYRADLESRIVMTGTGALSLQRIAVPVSTRPVRIRGRVGDGLYWALRSAGASTAVAADYLKALAGEIDVGDITPADRFDLVVASRSSSDGARQDGMLLYAAIDRTMGGDVQLVRWTAGGKPTWVNALTIGDARRDDNAMQWPVNARITSRFGLRVHPILRFARMHRGMDFGARWGTPIYAAADGQVTRAGWAGGYGRQVRLAHGDGMATSYSHMSSMTVAPGGVVQRGQLIGYVGSSGLSTGPHLHYEVYRGGVAVDPMSVRFVTSRPIDPGTVAAIKARVKELAP